MSCFIRSEGKSQESYTEAMNELSVKVVITKLNHEIKQYRQKRSVKMGDQNIQK